MRSAWARSMPIAVAGLIEAGLNEAAARLVLWGLWACCWPAVAGAGTNAQIDGTVRPVVVAGIGLPEPAHGSGWAFLQPSVLPG